MVIELGNTKKLEVEIKVDEAAGHCQDLIVVESNAKNAPKSGCVLIALYTTE